MKKQDETWLERWIVDPVLKIIKTLTLLSLLVIVSISVMINSQFKYNPERTKEAVKGWFMASIDKTIEYGGKVKKSFF